MARRLGVTASDVVAAAITIADRDGLDALTLAGVAAAVGVRTPSLYAHVDGIAGLRRALAAEGAHGLAAAARAARAAAPGDPVAALAALSRAYRDYAHRHPGLYAAMQRDAPDPGADPELASALYEPVAEVAAVLDGLGVTGDDAIHAIRAWRAALHGFVTLERSRGFGLPQSVDESFERLVEVLTRALANLR
jgi:AcrR family transcriptional regulator